MLDLHIHTKLCGHASGEMEEYVEEALKKKVIIFGFSDHLPHNHIPPLRPFPYLSMPDEQLSFYVQQVLKLKEKYSGKLEILLGIEADYYEGYEDETRKLLRKYPFDYAIGSIHVLNNWLFDSPRFIAEWDRRVVDEVYREYYHTLNKLIETGLFNIIGHMDIPKKFNHQPTDNFENTINNLGKSLYNEGMVVEINSSGLRYACQEMYPSRKILRILKENRVKITFGSDAHLPIQVGENYAQAVEFALAENFTNFCFFRNRKLQHFPLNQTTTTSVL